jgi:hypothetical protein
MKSILLVSSWTLISCKILFTLCYVHINLLLFAIGYPSSDYLKKTTPAPNTILLPAITQTQGQTHALSYSTAYNRLKNYLKDLCNTKLEHHKSHSNERVQLLFKELSPAQVADDLKHQIEAFWHHKWPFNQQLNDGNPLAWWQHLQDHPHARVLVVSTCQLLAPASYINLEMQNHLLALRHQDFFSSCKLHA